MSNIVKYPFVNLQGKEARTVSYEKPGDFTPLEKPKKVVIRDAKEVEEELEQGLSLQDIFKVPVKTASEDEEDFTAGLEVTNLDEMVEEKREEAQAEANSIVDSAREQADQIIVEAREQADAVRQQAYEEGFEAGKEEGIQAGAEETAQIREQLEAERKTLEDEYESMVAELEPKFVNLVGGLLEKLTGATIAGSDELILHLIRTGLKEVKKAERITIRVCPEDAVTAEMHKKEFLEEIGEDVTVDIQGQESLEKNDCIIEADNQMLDAGIHTQLEDLLTALRSMV